MTTRLPTAPPVRPLAGFAATIPVLVGGDLWLGLRYGSFPAAAVVSETAQAACFALAGLAAWGLRPRSRTGPWMLALGVLALVDNVNDFGLPRYPVIAPIGVFLVWFQYALVGHLLLAFPSGRLPGRPERMLLTAGFVLATLIGLANVILPADRLHAAVRKANLLLWAVLGMAAIVLLIGRVRRAPRRQRPLWTFTLTMFGLVVACYAAYAVVAAIGRPGYPFLAVLTYSQQWTAAILLPGTFFVGLLRERLAFASVGSLVGQLHQVPAAAVEQALGRTLRDESLRVAFPTAAGLLDAAGRQYQLDGRDSRAVTELGDPPFALLVHDPALREDPELLRAAAAAARLALDNARLYAEVQAQLAEVRASRRRIATAADRERQRLERDLHDTAQQRFLGVGLALGVLRGRLGDAQDRALVDEAEEHLRTAIREVRDIAHGARPAVLTDQGLALALAALARRATVRVNLQVQVVRRLSPIVEAAAYYVVSEALQNVGKHAPHATAHVHAEHRDGWLVVEVTDDGPGHATRAAGSGLRGLDDRVQAAGGRFTVCSPPGGGTRLRAELPCV
jgi:signal transduction histidine kinase